MSRFRKSMVLIIIFEFAIIIIFNLIYIRGIREKDAYYRVEAERLVQKISNDKILYENPEKIDLSEYSMITGVSLFDPDEICNNDYLVKEIRGKLYKIEYESKKDMRPFMLLNAGLITFLFVSLGVLLYFGRTILRPFNRMSDMTLELAKGNLSTPVKQEKSGFFKKFLWGMDMLREKLEDSKNKNLEYQKEKKMILLSITHDIKTPLSAMQLYAKALLEGIYDTESKKKAAYSGIMARTEEIKNYVDEIHRLSREEFMDFDVHIKEEYLSKIMNEMVKYYKDKLSAIHTSFKIDDYTDCILLCDPDRLQEVLQNLMENAIKYGDGKNIRITISEEENYKLINVINSGCTLDKNEIVNVFDSFYRGSNVLNISGNGLGLYIVKQLMLRMDGDSFVKIDDGEFKATVVVPKA